MRNLKTMVLENNNEVIVGNYLNESLEMIMEKLITVGGKAYPNFGHVVVMAGGAGSGKGFIKDTLLGVEGKVFDVDELKKLAMRSKELVARIKKDFGVDISKFDLTDPAKVSEIHDIIGRKLNKPRHEVDQMMKSAGLANAERKPNLIFDVTMKGIDKLENISRDVIGAGYDPKNIHIVWVINDITVAIKQNATRDRVVPEEILIQTHEGAALTMGKILDGSINVSKTMDGDIWLVFNQEGVDATLAQSPLGVTKANSQTPNKKPSKRANFSLTSAAILLVKRAGSKIDKSKLFPSVINKILDYVPSGSFQGKK